MVVSVLLFIVRVGGAAPSPSQLKAFAAQVPVELYAALGEEGAAACNPQSDPFCGEYSFLSTSMNSVFSYFLPSSSSMHWPNPHLPPTFLFQSGCICCCMHILVSIVYVAACRI